MLMGALGLAGCRSLVESFMLLLPCRDLVAIRLRSRWLELVPSSEQLLDQPDLEELALLDKLL